MEKYTSTMKNRIGIVLIAFTWFLVISTGCNDFVEIAPPNTEVTTESVFEDEAAVVSAVNGMYSQMINNSDNLFNSSLEVYCGIASDELTNLSAEQNKLEFARNDLTEVNSVINSAFWSFAFQINYTANTIIEGLSNSQINAQIRDQALGEAFFIRAIVHFYLVNLFGEIPYVNSTDVEINNAIRKESVAFLYNKVIEDLLNAQSLMSEDYSFINTGPRTRPNRATATALLARVYLYQEDWNNAEIQASNVINQDNLYHLENDLSQVFLTDSEEVIWQLTPDESTNQTQQGFVFVLPPFAPTFVWTNVLSDDFLNSFEVGDARQAVWTDTLNGFLGTFIYPFKYKIGFGNTPDDPLEQTVVLRLAEQYLIRAEARAQQGNIAGAQEDLNAIRTRSGLENTQAIDQISLLNAIEQERRMELFGEWGHRWFDLKRTGRASEVLSVLEGKDWQDTDVLWPLPEVELLNNPNLLPQNIGY